MQDFFLTALVLNVLWRACLSERRKSARARERKSMGRYVNSPTVPYMFTDPAPFFFGIVSKKVHKSIIYLPRVLCLSYSCRPVILSYFCLSLLRNAELFFLF